MGVENDEVHVDSKLSHMDLELRREDWAEISIC